MVNYEDQEIILKYFGIITTSISETKIGFEFAKKHMNIPEKEISRVEGELKSIIAIKDMFIDMCEELDISTV